MNVRHNPLPATVGEKPPAGRQHDHVTLSPEATADHNTEEHRAQNTENPRTTSSATGYAELTPEQKAQIAQLQQRDREVRAHEAAHKAAAGGMAVGGASFEYAVGPDGRPYAVGGEVSIRMSTGRTPEETLRNAEQVVRAALAPAQPSAQDIAVAAQANQQAAQARAAIAKEKQDTRADDASSGKEQDSRDVDAKEDTTAAQRDVRATSPIQ